MAKLLAQILKDEMDARKLSSRKVAQEIGMSHVTVTRILNGENMDVPTMQTVCNWLGVNLSDVLEQKSGPAEMARQLVLLINREPKLAATFQVALEEINKGALDPEDMRDIIEYAEFKLAQRRDRRGASKAVREG